MGAVFLNALFIAMMGPVSQARRDIINLLLNDPQINVDVSVIGYQTPLILSIVKADIKTFKSLLSKGADVNLAKFDTTPLMAAVLKNNKKMVKLLLAHGANISAQRNNGKTALMLAQEQDFEEIAQLLSHAANQN